MRLFDLMVRAVIAVTAVVPKVANPAVGVCIACGNLPTICQNLPLAANARQVPFSFVFCSPLTKL